MVDAVNVGEQRVNLVRKTYESDGSTNVVVTNFTLWSFSHHGALRVLLRLDDHLEGVLLEVEHLVLPPDEGHLLLVLDPDDLILLILLVVVVVRPHGVLLVVPVVVVVVVPIDRPGGMGHRVGGGEVGADARLRQVDVVIVEGCCC